MRLFLVTSGALLVGDQNSLKHMAHLLEAASSAEAEGIALRELKREAPDTEGWTAHDVRAIEVAVVVPDAQGGKQ